MLFLAIFAAGRDARRDRSPAPGRAASRSPASGSSPLLLFLIVDLPDAGKLGDLEDPVRGIASARAEPQAGFWLQALGAVTLALGGGAFATLSPPSSAPSPTASTAAAAPGDKSDPDPKPAKAPGPRPAPHGQPPPA